MAAAGSRYRYLYTLLHGLLALGVVQAQGDFDWDSLTASATLNWTSCYSGLQCALLEVPLDYTFQDKRNASIAIARIPATVSADEYLGPIQFNPGGPGGSGVSAIVSAGASFAEIFGPRFDIVGFDPRGVSFSKPSVNFFDSAAQRAFLDPRRLEHSFKLVGQQAKQHDTENVLQYLTTDNVARDLLRITEAFGFEKLQYWGVSYGTVLGQTFATLFPVRLQCICTPPTDTRCVMDGEAWFSANLTGSLTDANKALEQFFTGCFNAGPSGCAFYDSSPAKIASNLDALLQTFRDQPQPVLTNTSHGIVDFSFLRNVVFGSIYSPYNTFVTLAERLAELSGGNATNTYAQYQVDPFECDSSSDANVGSIFEAEISTACGDAGIVDDSIGDLRAFYANEAELSSFADIWGLWRIWCSGWKVHREGRFMGPVGANTSFPLLIIGNTADPVTPHMWAVKASTLFPNSALITQNSPGHTSLVAPSVCTHGALAAYFQNGTLPASGTVCEVDAELFPSSKVKTLVGEDSNLVNAIYSIAEGVRAASKGRIF
ncbi:TAP-like protein-domain-containing protein [Mycena amicta]|nr:TAP-like protein-domain-containing protein [Mycena amicta]